MTGDFKGTRHVNQLPHSVLIYRTIDIQDAKHNTVCAELFCNQDIALHDAEFIRAVAEITAARTDHYVESDLNLFAHGGNHPRAGRGAAFRKSGTQFNPISTSAL